MYTLTPIKIFKKQKQKKSAMSLKPQIAVLTDTLLVVVHFPLLKFTVYSVEDLSFLRL